MTMHIERLMIKEICNLKYFGIHFLTSQDHCPQCWMNRTYASVPLKLHYFEEIDDILELDEDDTVALRP